MTVAELIERLQQLPGELTVAYADGEYGPLEVESADIADYSGPREVVLR